MAEVDDGHRSAHRTLELQLAPVPSRKCNEVSELDRERALVRSDDVLAALQRVDDVLQALSPRLVVRRADLYEYIVIYGVQDLERVRVRPAPHTFGLRLPGYQVHRCKPFGVGHVGLGVHDSDDLHVLAVAFLKEHLPRIEDLC